jgi:sec-independent protein translocase protein TatA
LVFGTSRLKTIGTDLGGALKGFRRAMEHDESSAPSAGHARATPRIAEQRADGVAAERTEAERQA